MSAWWDTLTGLERFFAFLAIPASFLLLLQTVLLLFGVGGHGDTDAAHSVSFEDADAHELDVHEAHDSHADGGGFHVFTVRGLTAFFAVFGWSGIVFLKSGMPVLPAAFIALVLGNAFMFLIAIVVALVLKMQANGAADIQTAIGETASVYITIPPARSGKGKITVMVSGRLSEYEAVTDGVSPLQTGASVYVNSVLEDNTLVVVPNE